MANVNLIKSRIDRLRIEAFEVIGLDQNGAPNATGVNDDFAAARGWLVAAEHVIDTACPQGSSAYCQWIRAKKQEWVGKPYPNYYGAVMEAREILKRLLADIDEGLIGSIANQAAAETFDAFLDHGAEYLKIGQKNEAGVIVGVVFEDTIRRICRNNDIEENDVKLDQLGSKPNKTVEHRIG